MATFSKASFTEIVNRRLLRENEKLNEIAKQNLVKAKASSYAASVKVMSLKIRDMEKKTEAMRKELRKTEEKAMKAFPMIAFCDYDPSEKRDFVLKAEANLYYNGDSSYGNEPKVTSRGYACSPAIEEASKKLTYQVSQLRLALECYGKEELAKVINDFVEGKEVKF
jgi:hypothetical protein